MTTLREAAQQALEAIEGSGCKADLMAAADALRAALVEQKCPCGDRQANQCPGEWEPGCDLGANPKHAKVAEQAQPVAAQHRFRHPQKGTPDWSVWQPCKVAQRPAWEIDSQGYEVEYRALYTSPQPAPVAPPGWRMVPEEPTQEMAATAGPGTFWIAEAKRTWRTMVAAAPEAPTPPTLQPLTIERLQKALVGSRVVPPEAVEDPDNYDDGVMLSRIEALHRRLT